MITLEQMKQLITIEQEGTLSKASEKLFISQPALTRSMQRLEESIGVSLFEHKKNKLSLNETGKLAIQLSKEILKKHDEMIQTLKTHKQIHIGSIAIMPIRKLNHIENSKLTLQEDEDSLINKLYQNTYDCIILTHPINDSDYISTPLFDENLFIMLPKNHELSNEKSILLKQLDGMSILKYRHVGFWDQITIEKMNNPKIIYQDDESILNELRIQSDLPYFRTDQSMNSDIDKNRIAIPLSDDSCHVTYYAIYHKDNHLLPAILI